MPAAECFVLGKAIAAPYHRLPEENLLIFIDYACGVVDTVESGASD
jgi:hypothetical protein